MKNKHKQQLVKISRLLGHVAAEKIEPLVGKHKADFSANKLHTAIFLKLFLYAWSFDRSELSLRTIAEYSRSETFKELAELDDDFSVGKSGLGERLGRIPFQLFQELFEQLAQETLAALPAPSGKNAVVAKLLQESRIIDSTIITLSAKLLKSGYKMNEDEHLHVKASVAIAGRSIPVQAIIFTEKRDINENTALPALFTMAQQGIIYIFDRGIHKRSTYADIVKSGNHFLSRTEAKQYSVTKMNPLPEVCETPTLEIIQDSLIVFPKKLEPTQTTFRLIIGITKKDEQEITFITDLTDVSAKDITELYRHRWSSEIFFRFLKQELKLESLLSYSENGMKVHIYLTLIAFLLTWTFKEENKIASFKRAREKLKLLLLDFLMEQVFEDGVRQGKLLQRRKDTS